MKNCFRATRLFLPRGGYERWAAPAADSHPCDRDFWERVARKAGNAPSSLSCILPDVYSDEEEGAADGAAYYIYSILTTERIERVSRGFIITERKLKSNFVRRGAVAALDLEQFSYARGEITPVRATEAPSSRTEALIGFRQKALLEFPHTLLFFRDKKNTLLRSMDENDYDELYEFSLMEEGGHIRGVYCPEEDAYDLAADMATRGEPCFAVADGHDEIIAAKMYWERLKPSLKGNELKNHPARYALVECINLYDPAVDLFPVHRLVTETDAAAFADMFAKNVKCKRDGNVLSCSLAGAEGVRRADEVIAAYLRTNGGRVEYLDGSKPLKAVGEGALVLFKGMEKDDLFYDLKGGELMPRHTFTIGEDNKRYCLEGREISYD